MTLGQLISIRRSLRFGATILLAMPLLGVKPAQARRVPLASPQEASDGQAAQQKSTTERDEEARERAEEKRDREEERRNRDQERAERLDELYDEGREALDEDRFDRAAAKFGELASMNGSQTDAALYWKSYAENKLGKRDTALATLADLKRRFPQSRWQKDASALEIEVKQSVGNLSKPEAQSDEELKMIKTRAKASLIRSLGSNEGLAFALSLNQSRYDDWRELFRSVDRIDKVTKADIRRVANQTFVPENRTVGIIEFAPPKPGEHPPTGPSDETQGGGQ